MKLSRKWLNEFVDCSAWADHDFSEAMTLSGSKVELTHDLGEEIDKIGLDAVLVRTELPLPEQKSASFWQKLRRWLDG